MATREEEATELMELNIKPEEQALMISPEEEEEEPLSKKIEIRTTTNVKSVDHTDKPFKLQRDFPLHYLSKIGDPDALQNYFNQNKLETSRQLQRFDFLGRTVLHYAASTVNLSEEEKCVNLIISHFNELERAEEIAEEIKFENHFHKAHSHHGTRGQGLHQRSQGHHNPRHGGGGGHIVSPQSFLPHFKRHNESIFLRSDGTSANATNHRMWHGSRNLSNYSATMKFINKKDIHGESAIHIGARNENAGIVSALLMHGADVFSVSDNGENTLELIYSKTPSAVLALLDKSISFDCATGMDNFTKTERSYIVDFTALIGEQYGGGGGKVTLSAAKKPPKETRCLHVVSKLYPARRKDILSHPLVQLFVQKKVKKFQWVIWSSLAFHLTWIGFFMWHAMKTYYSCCELDDFRNSQGERMYCSKFPFDKFDKDKEGDVEDKWGEELRSSAFNYVKNCFEGDDDSDFGRALRVSSLWILSIFVILSHLFQVAFLWQDYIRPSNIFIWIFLAFVVVTVTPSVGTFHWQFQLTSFGILLGAFLILEEVNKHIYWTIYIKVLMKVIKRFLAILPLFLFLMLAFATSLRMLFPDLNPPIGDFLNAMMDVFGTVANGKVEWRDGRKYKESIANGFQVSGVVMFIAFYVTMILLLFRILIGFVVSDTKKIQEEEELNEIKQDLETLYLFESFLCSRGYNAVMIAFKPLEKILRKVREEFMLTSPDKTELNMSESEFPRQLKKPLRLLASKNPVKSSQEERL